MLVTSVITFANGAGARSQVAPAGTMVRELTITPDRGNGHVAFVGDSTLTQTGTTGVVSSLALPTATGIVDQYDRQARGGELGFDAGQVFVWGTLNEKVNVSYFSI